MNQGAQMDQGAKIDKGAKIDQGAQDRSGREGRQAHQDGPGRPAQKIAEPSKTNEARNPRRQRRRRPTEQKGGEPGKTGGRPRRRRRQSLPSDQRTKIRKLVINERDAPARRACRFRRPGRHRDPARPGACGPGAGDIVEIEPEWRGFMYFLVGDQIVIVEPDTLRIVAVIEA